MESAVLLAGYNNKKAVEKYSRIVQQDYGERFIERGYKPLHEFTIHVNGREVSKPLLQFTLEVLIKDKRIGDIVIVGHKHRIEDRLADFLSNIEKKVIILDQKEDLSSQVIEEFKINRKETPPGSVGCNLIKGYSATEAAKDRKPALFAASDSPMTTMDFINRFLENCASVREGTGIIMPAIYTDPLKDKLGRTPLLLTNDSEYHIPGRKDRFGRKGFRLSSLLLADPHKIDVNMINVMYSLRKALNPKTQLRIFRICREVGFPGIYKRYFIKKNLTILQSEAICSAFFKGKFHVIPMADIQSTYDFDGTEKEFIEISRMLDK